MPLRVLFLADSHLGFDLPMRARVVRRRRGEDFLANYRRALRRAEDGDIDLVVHGGDVFHRARPPHTLVYQAFEPLRRIADAGVPVVVVPGNHERSRIPHARFAAHPGIHVFDRPRTFLIRRRGMTVALAGFPYERRNLRERFRTRLAETAWQSRHADVRLLCVHHCFEGATVGPSDFTFRNAPDVIRCSEVPTGFAAVLTGHIHRHQVLRRDPAGRPLPAPVVYPGSTERTAFAEMGETKGYMLLDLARTEGAPGGRLVRGLFEELPTRPMVERRLDAEALGSTEFVRRLETIVRESPPDAVLRLRVCGRPTEDVRSALSAARLRRLAPTTMNLDVVVEEDRHSSRWAERRVKRDRAVGGRSATTGGRAELEADPETSVGLQLELPSVGAELP